MLEPDKRYMGQLGSGDDAEYIVFEVLEIDGFFVKAKKWRKYEYSLGYAYLGIAMLNVNQFNSIEDWAIDPRKGGAIPTDELPSRKPSNRVMVIPWCSVCKGLASGQCAVCNDYFCPKHGSIERDHWSYQTHYWVRCQEHPRNRLFSFFSKGDIVQTDWENDYIYEVRPFYR